MPAASVFGLIVSLAMIAFVAVYLVSLAMQHRTYVRRKRDAERRLADALRSVARRE